MRRLGNRPFNEEIERAPSTHPFLWNRARPEEPGSDVLLAPDLTKDSATDFRDSAEGPSSIRKARETPFWTGNRCTNWKITSRFVNMCRPLLLGTYPSGAYMGNPG